ncbi:hypothetical protein ACFQ1S_44205, partial [Kibdelosporangium lantanae]
MSTQSDRDSVANAVAMLEVGVFFAVPAMIAQLLSDPVDLPVGNDQDLVVSVFFPTSTGLTTFHSTSKQYNYIGPGDLASDPGGAGYTTERACCWFFLSGVD